MLAGAVVWAVVLDGAADVVVDGWAEVVVVVGGWVVVVVVVVGDCVEVGVSDDDCAELLGDVAGTSVTVGLPFGPNTVVCVGAFGALVLPGLVWPWPTVRANTTATSTAASAAATLTTSAVRLYHGSGPGSAGYRSWAGIS